MKFPLDLIGGFIPGFAKYQALREHYRTVRRARKSEKIERSLRWKMEQDGLSPADAITWVSVKYGIPEATLRAEYFGEETEE